MKGKSMNAQPPPEMPKSNALKFTADPAKTRDEVQAQIATMPIMPVALVITEYSRPKFGELSLTDVVGELKAKTQAVHSGDLREAESILIAQATALNTLFAELARRAALNLGEHIGAAETYLKLALRAQSQCRATLESLAGIKNPPVIFAKQANIAHGPQQVNNGVASEPTRVEKNVNPPNELLGNDHGKRLDTGTASTASIGDPFMATVGTLDRATHGARKGSGKP